MKRTTKWVRATGAALMLFALVSASAVAGGFYSFSFGYNSRGHYGPGYRGWCGYPRYSYGFAYYYAPPVYYCPPPVVYRPYYYSAPPVYYYSGGAFYRR
jgi:hypothetical protein